MGLRLLAFVFGVFTCLSCPSASFAGGGVKPIKEVFEPAIPDSPEKFMKVAVVQWNPYGVAPIGVPQTEADAYLQYNRDVMAERLEVAVQNGAKYISFSEFAVPGYPDIPELPSDDDNYRNRDDIRPFVETVPGNSTTFFSALAKKHRVWIQFGIAEVDPKTDKYYNTAVVVNDCGKIVASFRKQNLYQLETNFLSPGTEAVVFKTPFGRVGLTICADIYHYTLLNEYRRLGVDVISLSTSWAQSNTGMQTFISAAQHVGSYVLAANQTYFPDSGVINPDGTTQSHIRQSGDAIAYGYLPLK